jgi:hypothetical protein
MGDVASLPERRVLVFFSLVAGVEGWCPAQRARRRTQASRAVLRFGDGHATSRIHARDRRVRGVLGLHAPGQISSVTRPTHVGAAVQNRTYRFVTDRYARSALECG